MLKDKDAYKKLPSQTAQQTLKSVDRAWKSFFNYFRDWKEHAKKYFGRPHPPNYKKKNGEYTVTFTNQQCKIKDDHLHFPKKVALLPIKTRLKRPLHCVRIIPKGIYYIFEIIYEKTVENLNLDKKRVVGIDLGLNNIVTVVNNAGLKPFVIKGGIVKSINQFYNKQLAKYKSIKDKQGYAFETIKLQTLTRKRNNKISNIFHKISRNIINYCFENNFGTIILGYNKTWKQNIKIGIINNQNFVQIPFLKLLNQIQYKSDLDRIAVIKEKESFTSKCSFLDGEPVRRRERYAGKRFTRGLFKTRTGTIINADVNAGYNIMKKTIPNAVSADGIEAVGLHPYSITIS
jgi:putative transposase